MITRIKTKLLFIFMVLFISCESTTYKDQETFRLINKKYNAKLNTSYHKGDTITGLRIYGRYFSELPKEIMDFEYLKALRIDGVNIKKLPDWIKELKQLKTVTIVDVPFNSFPEELLELDSMEHFSFNGNELKELPSELHFENLKSIYLSELKIQKLPLLYFNSKEGMSVILRKTDINEIPNEYRKYRIREFIIEDNRQLDHVDNLFGTYDSLKEVKIEYRGHTKFPMESFKKCYNLEVLSLTDQGLWEFPDFIYQNTKLKRLYIGNNPFEKISSQIIKLQNLEYLGLYNSLMIADLPEELFALPKLEAIDIKSTLIGKLPSGIMGLPKREVPMKIYVSNAPESYVPLGMSLDELNEKGYILKN
ncbi:leucine-rich repeat domain-containing protein [Flammeovirga aprica]|uniref:Leucine-rich repeat domain-containing protein n=1 Tax=Flammeovirga aprica JL-4 TaxID=694437 RepID=A0A7X9P0I1_9BACT|nr:leucine-rich repeat domain-containing protein [Flammeovirga aprica]NME66757.1 leucine-rich repeat domain-containing protein [Flammeovirga aprica JL-4]